MLSAGEGTAGKMPGTGEEGRSRIARRISELWRGSSSFSLGSSGAVPGIAVMVALYMVYMVIDPQPRTLSGFGTILGEAATVGLAGVGEAIVVLSGGYDLSTGAVVGVVNVILATRTGFASHTPALIVIGLGVGIGAGVLNGVAVAALRVPPIIATLGSLFIWQGVALLILAQPGGTVDQGFVNALSGSVGNIPMPLILFAIAAVLWRATKYTRAGRHVYMLGGDEDSTRANGVDVRRAVLFTYGFAGLFYGLAGLFYTAFTTSGDPSTGSSLLLPIFAAVVLGGILFGGGKGDPAAAIIGAVTLTLISDVLYALGVSSFYTGVFDGAALIVALAFSMLSGRLLVHRPTSGHGRTRAEKKGVVE
ncbi:MAG: ABC transporter permease [Dehalococcoidales bacterium]|nr:ABC transporter permease [Dehalococcoidales bacterium]